MVDISLGKVCVEVWTLDEPEEELVDYFEVWPGEFEHWLIFFRVVSIASRIDGRGYRTEKVGCKLGNGARYQVRAA